MDIDVNELVAVFKLQRDTAQDSLAMVEVQRRMLVKERDALRKRVEDLETAVAKLSPPHGDIALEAAAPAEQPAA